MPPLSHSLPGTWQLLSRVDTTADGVVVPDPALGSDPIALLVYDGAGHFTAQFMKRVRDAAEPAKPAEPSVEPAGAGVAKNNTRAQGGYDAYFGTYEVDDETGCVTQRLIGSLNPANVGMQLTRAMTVTGDRLVIALETNAVDGTPVTRTLTWERVG